MLLVDVGTVIDGELLAALKVRGSQGVERKRLAVQRDGVAVAGTALEQAVVDRQKIAGVVGLVEIVFLDTLLDGRVDAHAGGLTVERDVDAAIGVPDDARHKEEQSAANCDERVRLARVAATGAESPAASLVPQVPGNA